MKSLEELLPILACPVCSGSLGRVREGLECESCHRAYSLSVRGVPILLSPESERMIQDTEKAFGQSLLARDWQPPNWPLLRRLFTPPSATLDLGMPEVVRVMHQHLDSAALVLFLGGMRPRDYIYFSNYRAIVLDIIDGPNIDILGDAHCLPIRAGQFDAVVSQAVLEHVPDPRRVLECAWQALRPGGVIYVSVPFVQPYHFGPMDYRRYTLRELEQVMNCSHFEKLAAGVASGPGSSLAWLLRVYAGSFSERPAARHILEALAGWSTFALKYTDHFLIHKRTAELAACAIYYVGRKSLDH